MKTEGSEDRGGVEGRGEWEAEDSEDRGKWKTEGSEDRGE